jgi:uncharacterized protein (TIRG00374 family)
MSLTRQDWIKILVGVAVSVLALALIVYLVDFQRLADALRGANYALIALLFLVTLIWLLVRGMAWRALLQNKASFAQVFLTLNEGYLLNNVLPLRLGEVGRAFLLSRKARLGFPQVLSTVIIERALDLGYAAGVLLGTLPFVVGGAFAKQAAVTAGVLVLAGLLALHLLARNQDWAMRQIEHLSARVPVLQRLAGSRQIESFFDGLAALVDVRRFLTVLFWITLNWTFSVLQFFVLVRAFFPQAPLLWGAFTLGAMAFGVAAPSSPGAVGVMEAAIIGALALFGVDPSTGLAIAVTAHLTNYLLTGAIGGYALVHDGLSLSSIFRDLRKIEPASPEEGG